jgi:hypothetical protein
MNKPKGVVSVVTAFFILILMGFTALAVDVAYMYLVRAQLQNAADSSALAGASSLSLYGGTTSWNDATASGVQRAQQMIVRHEAAGTSLKHGNGNFQSAVWDGNSAPAVSAMPPGPPGASEIPVFIATVSRTALINDPVKLYFARFLGFDTVDLQATAIAAVTSPGSVFTGGLAPFAMNQCLFTTYWDTAAKQPVNDSSGNPYNITIGPKKNDPLNACGSGDSGIWTSFEDALNSVPAIRKLIDDGNPDTLSIGDSIWIQPGVQGTLYGDLGKKITKCHASSDPDCNLATVPVVNSSSLDQKTFMPVVAFACIKLISATQKGGSGEIVFQLSAECESTGSGIGPSYGASTPPRLIQ